MTLRRSAGWPRRDADPETRDRAADRLTALAAGTDEAAAVAAVRALTDAKRLSAIARSDAAEAVRTEALARTTDERALASVAKHAKIESTAAAALARVNDRDLLIEIAQNADHKDIALARVRSAGRERRRPGAGARHRSARPRRRPWPAARGR